ncbi:hypothetical protein [Pragia fontium]|uniref:hypothetical protein n=1 Tax=Pragia fontium TaxID=82985 RepID=UPI0015F0A2EE|nr:hypothetical protein [Pragia fontium]
MRNNGDIYLSGSWLEKGNLTGCQAVNIGLQEDSQLLYIQPQGRIFWASWIKNPPCRATAGDQRDARQGCYSVSKNEHAFVISKEDPTKILSIRLHTLL